MDLNQLHKNLKRLDLEAIAAKIFKSLDKYISDLNREQLAKYGVNDDGEKLQPEYTEVTNMIKTRYGSGTGGITSHVTLFNKGDLHKSIFSKYDGEELILGSFDEKVGELTQKYGEFLGLTDENILKLKDKFLPLFWDQVYGRVFK
jgi:hypothetical protein